MFDVDGATPDHKPVRKFTYSLICFLGFLCPLFTWAAGKAEHVVVLVWDGMRPDFITAEYTPALHRLVQEGVLHPEWRGFTAPGVPAREARMFALCFLAAWAEERL